MLLVENLVAGYGAAKVLHEVSLEIARGEAAALIGPNGAGKSTLMAAIMGVIEARSGRIVVDGTNVTGHTTHSIMTRGLSLVPEGRRIFAPFTVRDNLRMGSIRLSAGRPGFDERLDYVYGLFPRLKQRESQLGGTLSGGEQQMLAIGRALMSNPRILLLDEPFLGLAPKVIEEIQAAVRILQEQGLTLLLVEQKLDIALNIASRACVLIKGSIALESSSDNLKARSDLDDLYFSLAEKAA
ncbi:ABC transporter ATP-binding protein [Mesorhizobium sp.]|uniref:ABC transporter ATP-binding protein n=1 Tax=Mesorhizobium sp. TaxID=1871066 RepID=UPI000FEA3D13|nr:ABC transporter ATP-binding protein [Mesorhizobium sp.]RWM45480.1 MAG: ABC transporter ATP-binding protein [Mesorhizobium sp.]RWM58200.1 MAG: ABC transporter ATP-binding protein [Mesorhizobium sp.]RWM58635.1 MAG: ABC transporter ATP-binding protein [Mesorhizobium sp.]TIO70066.1 MAG: ABC transporter ATP-binding protein [Mesorhizobium sp.]TJV93956.1 MAG: ABC transporter ATP-binding protein [Mesorhizobium sp.]